MKTGREAKLDAQLRALGERTRAADLASHRIRDTQHEARRLLAARAERTWAETPAGFVPRLVLGGALAAALMVGLVWALWPQGGAGRLEWAQVVATPAAAVLPAWDANDVAAAAQRMEDALRAYRLRHGLDGAAGRVSGRERLWREVGDVSRRLHDDLQGQPGLGAPAERKLDESI